MPSSWVSLLIALLAVVPGFLAAATWARARTWKGPSGDLRTVLESLAFSLAIQIVLSPLTFWMLYPFRNELEDRPGRVALWLLIAVIICPLIAGVAAARLSDFVFPPTSSPWAGPPEGWRRLTYTFFRPSPPPTAWDTLFLINPPHAKFVSMQFDDGSLVGGVFSRGSVAMTTPEPHGLFLAQEWLLDGDGNFIEPVANSAGILIRKIDDVKWIRIQSGSDESLS